MEELNEIIKESTNKLDSILELLNDVFEHQKCIHRDLNARFNNLLDLSNDESKVTASNIYTDIMSQVGKEDENGKN